MGKPKAEFKMFIVEQRLIEKKSYVQIEREHGVLRGTTYAWVKNFENGTLFIDKRKIKNKQKSQELEYEFLKKCFALLKEIRVKQPK